MRRIAVVPSLVAVLILLAAPAVMAAGGGNPPPGTWVIVNPAIQGIFLVDIPAGGGTKLATVYLRQGTLTTQATFNIVQSLQNAWPSGCNTTYTNSRFLWAPPTFQTTLPDLVPPFVLQSLLLPFGIFPGPGLIPVITQISGNQCLQNQPTWLLMNATIQFLVPAK